MNKEVFVSVKGIQQDIASKEQDEIEFIAKGKYYEKGDKKFIAYRETQMEEKEEILSTLKIENNRVTLVRMGNNSANMLFEVGQKHVSQYSTQFGLMELGITTRSLDIELNDNDGEINIKYLLEVNNNPVGVNDLSIKFNGNKETFKLM